MKYLVAMLLVCMTSLVFVSDADATNSRSRNVGSQRVVVQKQVQHVQRVQVQKVQRVEFVEVPHVEYIVVERVVNQGHHGHNNIQRVIVQQQVVRQVRQPVIVERSRSVQRSRGR
jgi:hypothetical protein